MNISWLQTITKGTVASTRAATETPLNSNKLNEIHVPTGGEVDGTNLTLSSVVFTITTVTDLLLNVVALLAALYFLYGAFSYIISYGNDAKTTKAKQTMTWAIVGIIVAMLAKFAVGFVKNGLPGVK